MVKVITIMDDVYEELVRLKRPRGMSFSEVLRHLLAQRKKHGKSLLEMAGSLEEGDINRRALHKLRNEGYGKNMPG